jgi:hypothetical protein
MSNYETKRKQLAELGIELVDMREFTDKYNKIWWINMSNNKPYCKITKKGGTYNLSDTYDITRACGNIVDKVDELSKYCPECKKRNILENVEYSSGYIGHYVRKNKCRFCGTEWETGYLY